MVLVVAAVPGMRSGGGEGSNSKLELDDCLDRGG